MKKCPYCAEDIQDAAIVCRFCNREMPKPTSKARPWIVVGGILIVAAAFSFLTQSMQQSRTQPVESTAHGVPPPPGAQWIVGGVDVSAMDGSRSVLIRVKSENKIVVNHLFPQETSGELSVDCKDGRIEDVYVHTGGPSQAVYGEYDKATVRSRFDDEKPTSSLWLDSTNNKALFFPQPEAFVRRMRTAKSFRFEFTPYGMSEAVFVFDVSGFDSVIQTVGLCATAKK